MSKKVILYFGSFNPIHNGHLTIANYVLDRFFCSEVWYIISPHNPFKKSAELASEKDRLAMAEMAVKVWDKSIKVSDIEFEMSRPSYTINTIQRFKSLYPETDFMLMIGEDNIFTLDGWREWKEILRTVPILVYPRGDGDEEAVNNKILQLTTECDLKLDRISYLASAPLIHLSSSEVREKLSKKEEINDLTPCEVINYIKINELYESR